MRDPPLFPGTPLSAPNSCRLARITVPSSGELSSTRCGQVNKLLRAAKERQIELVQLPIPFERHQTNKSIFNEK